MEATEEQIEMYSYYSDVFKDVHNIRPRWLHPADHTVEEWRMMIDEIIAEGRELALQALAEEEKEFEQDDLAAWYDTSAELD